MMKYLVSTKNENRMAQQSQVTKSQIVMVKGNLKIKKTALEERNEHVEEFKSELHEKHADSYTSVHPLG